MKVIYHIGLHCTDEDRALRCLLRNADTLARQGTVVSLPGRFRPVLRQAMIHLRGAVADTRMQEQVLDAVTDVDHPERLIFSNDSFLCVPQRAIDGNVLYPLAGERAPWIRNLFPDHPAEFAFALRNPATLIPAMQARFADKESFGEFLARIEPEEISWIDMIERFRAAVPDCPVTIWANEDTPLIWTDVLETLAAPAPGTDLEGSTDFLATLMSAEGVTRMERYLEAHPPRTREHRHRVISAFLDKFAREDAVEVEYDLPGWDAARVTALTDRYEAELSVIAEMPGITFLQP
ncbi:hypothetical protein CLV78_101461 [Aliiruegeria haliotis]|uniref:Sulfotransferase family protein n=1 Tax=Aliiruegeria haliotis TaxID=1280846 RepID=A0A2T0RYU9_9RHOB|nr:hypothetical protein [Aliiruegeria haliotis]PRY26366.1 hypothetical protein CLV78_101461 [Aliiruegeria haliotis]